MSAGSPKSSAQAKKDDPPASQEQKKERKGRGKRDRRMRQPMEMMSVVDAEEKLSTEDQEFFKNNKCNYFIGLRLPESIRQVMFESLYYMVDFRRFERRRLHLTDPEKFHTTLVNVAVPKDSVDTAKEAFEKVDVAALQKCDINVGHFGSFPGPQVYARMAEKGNAGHIPKAVAAIEKAMKDAGLHTRSNEERKYKSGSEYIHTTLIKPTRGGAKKRADRGLSEAKAVQHVLSESFADDYDWKQHQDKTKDILDVDMPADASQLHHTVSLDLCAMAETDSESGYYKVLASKKVSVGFQMQDMKYIQAFVKDVESETGKRVKTGDALKEAEAEKAKKREERREKRESEQKEAEKNGKESGKGKGRRRRRGKGKGKGSKEDGDDAEKKEGEEGEKKEGGKRRSRKSRGKGSKNKEGGEGGADKPKEQKKSTKGGDKKESTKGGDKKESTKGGDKQESTKGGEKKERGSKGSKGKGKRSSASDNEETKKPSSRGKGKGKGDKKKESA